MAEAYRRRKYEKYFESKLNDSATENTETEVWLEFTKDCNYISTEEYTEMIGLNSETGKLIWYMINNPEKFS